VCVFVIGSFKFLNELPWWVLHSVMEKTPFLGKRGCFIMYAMFKETMSPVLEISINPRRQKIAVDILRVRRQFRRHFSSLKS
jgi:hypothetical protein